MRIVFAVCFGLAAALVVACALRVWENETQRRRAHIAQLLERAIAPFASIGCHCTNRLT
jgi:hypothetical protein